MIGRLFVGMSLAFLGGLLINNLWVVMGVISLNTAFTVLISCQPVRDQ